VFALLWFATLRYCINVAQRELRLIKPLPAERMPGQCFTFKNSGLPSFAQKILLQQIERNGGIDHYRNKDNKKEQLLRPLLFGGRGDNCQRQASDCVKYWYNNFYKEDTYKELLVEFGIPCCLDSANILPTPRTPAPSGKTTSNTR
jgi:hypothetical protein